MRLAVRLVRGAWPAVVERRLRRFTWADPRVIGEDDVDAQAFRDAMNAVHVGGTYKITGSGRHTAVDDLLLQHVDLSGATVVDIGASDGSTSVDLVARMPDDLGSFVIADLYLTLLRRDVGRHVLFYDADGACVLVVGRRFLGWPQMSRFARTVYAPVLASARRAGQPGREVLLLNPVARRLLATDPRVSTRTHDVFRVWAGSQPDVIKVANLLRRLYFDDADIGRALDALFTSLRVGGHLLIVDNPRIAGIALRGGLFRRDPDGFTCVATTPDEPEILDLVTAPRAGAPRRADATG